MGEIRDQASISRRWVESSSQKQEEYTRGVQNPRRKWAASAIAAKGSYKDAVIDAANKGRYEAGVAAAGDAKWLRRVVALGAQRYVPGVQLAEQDHLKGFTPYYNVIKALDYGPRYPTGDPRNLDRVKKGAVALRNKKLELLGGAPA